MEYEFPKNGFQLLVEYIRFFTCNVDWILCKMPAGYYEIVFDV